MKYGHRLVIDTILYVLASGCAWRLVPHDLAPWDAAYRWFRYWSAQGVWDDIHEAFLHLGCSLICLNYLS